MQRSWFSVWRPAPLKTETKEASDVKNVVYIVNGNLGDKSFFDSAQAGIDELVKAGRITCKTIELGGTDEDQPKWLSTLYDVSESGEYDLVICGTYQMPDYLKEVATKYPDQLYLIFDDNTYAGENSNVVNITYKQNDMGYLIGIVCRLHDHGYQHCQHQRGCGCRLCRRR